MDERNFLNKNPDFVRTDLSGKARKIAQIFDRLGIFAVTTDKDGYQPNFEFSSNGEKLGIALKDSFLPDEPTIIFTTNKNSEEKILLSISNREYEIAGLAKLEEVLKACVQGESFQPPFEQHNSQKSEIKARDILNKILDHEISSEDRDAINRIWTEFTGSKPSQTTRTLKFNKAYPESMDIDSMIRKLRLNLELKKRQTVLNLINDLLGSFNYSSKTTLEKKSMAARAG
ncbi:MAG: hypothetical protein M1383_05670 [Patescibacteria group bacterium]|nr:hypothetical protein [Patescibacteria group bacterium]